MKRRSCLDPPHKAACRANRHCGLSDHKAQPGGMRSKCVGCGVQIAHVGRAVSCWGRANAQKVDVGECATSAYEVVNMIRPASRFFRSSDPSPGSKKVPRRRLR